MSINLIKGQKLGCYTITEVWREAEAIGNGYALVKYVELDSAVWVDEQWIIDYVTKSRGN